MDDITTTSTAGTGTDDGWELFERTYTAEQVRERIGDRRPGDGPGVFTDLGTLTGYGPFRAATDLWADEVVAAGYATFRPPTAVVSEDRVSGTLAGRQVTVRGRVHRDVRVDGPCVIFSRDAREAARRRLEKIKLVDELDTSHDNDGMTEPAEQPGRCCDLHGRNCEQGGEECCAHCTEAHHFAPGHGGVPCSAPDLSGNAEAPAGGIAAVRRVVADTLAAATGLPVVSPDGPDGEVGEWRYLGRAVDAWWHTHPRGQCDCNTCRMERAGFARGHVTDPGPAPDPASHVLRPAAGPAARLFGVDMRLDGCPSCRAPLVLHHHRIIGPAVAQVDAEGVIRVTPHLDWCLRGPGRG